MSICPVNLFLTVLPLLAEDDEESINQPATKLVKFLDDNVLDIHDVFLPVVSRLLLEIREYSTTDNPFPLNMELDCLVDDLLHKEDIEHSNMCSECQHDGKSN